MYQCIGYQVRLKRCKMEIFIKEPLINVVLGTIDDIPIATKVATERTEENLDKKAQDNDICEKINAF